MAKNEIKLEMGSYGEIELDRSSSIIFHREFPLLLQKKLSAQFKRKEVEGILYRVAKRNATDAAKTIADSIVGLLGKFNAKKLAEEMLKQFPTRGYGMATLESFDPSSKRLVVVVDNCFNSIGVEDPEHTCAIAAGILAGAAFSVTGSEMDAVETNCVAKGDASCRFELFPTRSWR